MNWLETVRAAIESWLLHDLIDAAGTATAPDILTLAGPGLFDTTTAVGRTVRVTVADAALNVGEYTVVAAPTSSTLQLSPAWPGATGGAVTFQLNTAIDAIARNWYFLSEASDKLPPESYVSDDCPAIVVTQNKLTVRQANNTDLEYGFNLHFMCTTAGRSCVQLNNVLGRLYDRLLRGRSDRFGLDSTSGLQASMPSAASADPKGNKGTDGGVVWQSEFDYNLLIRRGIQSLA